MKEFEYNNLKRKEPKKSLCDFTLSRTEYEEYSINNKKMKEFNKPLENFAIFINTCDAYSDCWIPFFELFKKYWPNYSGKIYLNTEFKDFKFQGLEIDCIKVSSRNNLKENTSWGVRFKKALEYVEENTILYFQDDYFLNDYVGNREVLELAYLMEKNNEIDCIHITQAGAPSGGECKKYNSLDRINMRHLHSMSLQAALWKKSVLIKYVRTYESIWNFEWWGSKRVSILNDNFFVVKKDWVKNNQTKIVPYVITGLTAGKWNRELVNLFEQNNIKIDFNERGFFERIPITFKNRVRSRWKRLPVEIVNSIDILMLKLKKLFKS